MEVLDLDKFIPDENKIKLGGKEFDLTFIPAEYGFRLQNMMDALLEMEKSGKLSEEDSKVLMNIVFDILQEKDESVELAWFRKHMTHHRLIKFLPRLANAVFGIKKNGEEDDFDTSI